MNSVTLAVSALTLAHASLNQYEVKVVELKTQPTLVMHGKSKIEEAGASIGGIFEKLGAYMQAHSISAVGAPFTRTFSFENGVIEFESGFPIEKATVSSGEYLASELPAGLAATTEHVGGHEESQKAYAAIEAWTQENQKQIIGAPWEVYLNEESQGEPAKMQVYYPIQ